MLITHHATLIEKKELAPEIHEFTFSYPDNTEWSFQAGQYMIFHIPQQDAEHSARRLYSIASSPAEKSDLKFIVETVPNGLGSNYLHNMKIGETAMMQGPAGLFTYKPSERDSVFLATGTGIAPMYSILSDLLKTGNRQPTTNFHLFWGLKHCKDLYYLDKFKNLHENHENFSFKLCISRETDLAAILGEDSIYGVAGRVTKGLEQLTTDNRKLMTDYDYYLCGGPNVVESLREHLAQLQVPKEQVHFEKFTGL